MRIAATLFLTLAPATLAFSQTTPAKKPVAHHTTTAATTLPASIPKIAGIAKPLFSFRYIDIKVGTGPLAPPTILGTSQANSKIMFYTVKYTGWVAKDGTKFDSSYDHPGAEPYTFVLGVHRVILGWDLGFEGMHIGGQRRLFIPYQLAYGEGGRSPIPPKADLIFDIELVNATDQPPTPPAAPKPTPESAAPDSTAKPAADPAKPVTDPATNDPAKATTPDNATKPAPKPSTNPPGV